MGNRQTALEWLEENLIGNPHYESDFVHNRNVFNQAKAMEKQQIMDARDSLYNEQSKQFSDIVIYGKTILENLSSEEYYNKTYGK